MKVFLAGGTGAIGRHALKALVDAGHAVSALVRTDDKSSLVRSLGAIPVRASLFDRAELVSVMGGYDAVVNLATAIPPNSKFMQASAWALNDRIRIEGSSNLVNAALSCSVKRFVQESVVMLYKDSGDAWIDESSETEEFQMARGNHAAEASANQFAASGGAGVILRFGWFYGPGATHSEEFLDFARRRGVCIMFGPPNSYLSSIHVEDGGRAVAAALDAPSGVYNITDDEPLTKRAYADALAAAVGRKHALRAPGYLALLLGDKSTSLTRSVRATNDRFKKQTGWTPRYPSAREGWTAMAQASSS